MSLLEIPPIVDVESASARALTAGRKPSFAEAAEMLLRAIASLPAPTDWSWEARELLADYGRELP